MVLKCMVARAMVTPPSGSLDSAFHKESGQGRGESEFGYHDRESDMVAALRGCGLWDYVSPAERDFLQCSNGNRESLHMDAAWKAEAAAMIKWALGLGKWPRIDEVVDPNIVADVPVRKVGGLFSRIPKLRPCEEIDRKRDLLELWQWRIRQRRLEEQGLPPELDESMLEAGLTTYDQIIRHTAKTGYEQGILYLILEEDFAYQSKPFRTLSAQEFEQVSSVVAERCRALNWLCGRAPGNRWDETNPDMSQLPPSKRAKPVGP